MGSRGGRSSEPTLTLAQLLDSRGVGLANLSALTGIGVTTLRDVMKKAARGVPPRPEQIAKLCKALDAEPRALGWKAPLPLITARVAKGWSRDDLVKHAGVGKSTVARLETEEVAEPSAEVVLRLSRAVEWSPETLGWRPPPPLVAVRVFELQQTQGEFATSADVGRATVERIERGEIVPKTAVTAWKLARAAQRTPLELGWEGFDASTAEAGAAAAVAAVAATAAQGQSTVRDTAKANRVRTPELGFRGHSVVVGDLMVATWPPLTIPDMPRLPQPGALQAGARKQILDAATAHGVSQLRREVSAARYGRLEAPQTGGVLVRRIAEGDHVVPWNAQGPENSGDLVPPVNVRTWRRDTAALAQPTDRAFADANRQAVVVGFRVGAQGAWLLEGALRSLEAAHDDPGLAMRGIERTEIGNARAMVVRALAAGRVAEHSPAGPQRSVARARGTAAERPQPGQARRDQGPRREL